MIYRIVVDVEVEDEEALLQYARERYRACWFNEMEEVLGDDETEVQRALLEALLFSNENPSPADYGIGFTGNYSIGELADQT